MPITIRGYQPQEEVSFSLIETPNVLSGTTLPAQVYQDFIADKTTATLSDNNCTLGVSSGALNTSVSATSLTQSVCTISQTGLVSRVTNGACVIEVAAKGSKKNFTRTMAQSGGGVSYAQTGYVTNSLAKHIADNVAAMVSGKTPGASQFVFSGESHNVSAPAGTRNGSLFSSLDLSATSFVRTGGDARYPVHLISARHFIYAAHVGCSVGDTVTWLGNDNVFRSATVSAISGVSGLQDTYIGYLSAPISGITPYYFLPSTWKTNLPSVVAEAAGQLSIPALLNLWDDSTGRRKLHIVENPRRTPADEAWAWVDYSNPKAYGAWNAVIQPGDSSSIVLLPVIDVTLKSVLITSLYSAAGGAAYSEQLSVINAVMTAQAGSSYAVQTVSLAGFEVY